MIRRLTMTNFKNFRDASLCLGKLSVLIGTNASGKSNLREAFRLLNGIARNYTLADIFGEKWVEGYTQWKGIRGGHREVCFHGSDSFGISVEIDGYTYSINVKVVEKSIEPLRVSRESLHSIMRGMLFDSHPPDDKVEQPEDEALLTVRLPRGGNNKKHGKKITISSYRPALLQVFNHAQIPKDIKPDIERVASHLLSMRFLDLSPDAMRIPSTPGQTVLGDRGENLSSVLQGICSRENMKVALLEWVRQLTPMDVDDFEFISDLSGKIVLGLKERDGRVTTAYSVSDGTLRFLGLIAAIMDPRQARLYFFEEIENGIHPTRIGLLIKFIEQRIGQDHSNEPLQVVTTTHSPQLLRFLNPENQEASSLIYRLEDAPDAKIRKIMEIPHIKEVLKNTNLAELHESGWFENVASFLEDEEHHQ